MKEIRVGVGNFDLDTFIHETLNFVRTVLSDEFDPSYAVAWVEDHEPDYGPETEARDLSAELLEDRKVLFFPFSGSNVGDPIPCANGEEYVLDDWGDLELYGDEEENFDLSDTECAGYLIKVENREFVINSAVHGGSNGVLGAYVNPVPDCGTLDGPMTEFVSHFIVG